MVRTNLVRLRSADVVGYRFRLKNENGVGVTLMRSDLKNSGVCVIGRTNGEPVLSQGTMDTEYPMTLFREAIKFTKGLPYVRCGLVRYDGKSFTSIPSKDDNGIYESLVNSREYQSLMSYYTDTDGRFVYERLNTDVIRLLNEDPSVRFMAESYHDLDVVRDYVLGTQFRAITGSDKFMSDQVIRIEKLMNLVYPGFCFKEMDAFIKSLLCEKNLDPVDLDAYLK